MKHIGILVLGAVAGGYAAADAPADSEPPPVAPLEADEPAGEEPEFTAAQLRQLAALRAWLVERKRQRVQEFARAGESTAREDPLSEAERQVLTPLGQRYALGFHSRPSAAGPYPLLRIGRGTDGRIYHRYVFERPIPQATGSSPLAAGAPAEGGETPPARRPIVRLRLPPSDRSAVSQGAGE
ncbi:hypothetical protein [Candidatus Methylocalor cossyra]|uniref:Uncharacterized protein n=1 Tax=Candidatus Methylocalor cossyra TaxID=3108543 RepID=A0ABP1C5F2_9GAMM